MQQLIDLTASGLDSINKAKQSIDSTIAEMETALNTALMAADMPAVLANAAAARVIDFHLNKYPGSFGSYGIRKQLENFKSFSDNMANEITFRTLAIGLYTKLRDGVDISGTALPPGYDPSAGAGYHVDMDNPMSMYRLTKSSDVQMQNRPGYVYPDSPGFGDMICINDVVHIFM